MGKNGRGEDLFSPNSPVTRGQLVTFLWRTLGKPGETGQGAWYADAENWAEGASLTKGTARAYATGDPCPRADVVYYLWKALK